MIQFNLLPDVKLEYIKAQRTKQLVVTLSTLVTAAALLLLVLLLADVFVVQKHSMSSLTTTIKKDTANLQATPDLDKILTVQNQLNSLTSLHQQKHDSSRLLPYLYQVTPAQVSVSSLTVDFDSYKMTITGGADTLTTVNSFVDTLKFTKFTVAGQSDKKLAFSGVVLSAFGRASGTDQSASYTIDLSFDQALFDNTKKVSLVVPDQVTTRSEVDKPSDFFQTTTTTKSGGAQ